MLWQGLVTVWHCTVWQRNGIVQLGIAGQWHGCEGYGDVTVMYWGVIQCEVM